MIDIDVISMITLLIIMIICAVATLFTYLIINITDTDKLNNKKQMEKCKLRKKFKKIGKHSY